MAAALEYLEFEHLTSSSTFFSDNFYYYNAPVLKFDFHSHFKLPSGKAVSFLTVHFTSLDGCQQMDSLLLTSRSLSRAPISAAFRSFPTTPLACF
jgi:hypothetical protein